MKYLAVLGRQPEISLAELESLGFLVGKVTRGRESAVAELKMAGDTLPFNPARLGGTQKLAVELDARPLDYLAAAPEGKLTFGLSDYSPKASPRGVKAEALKLKRILARHERSVRTVENQGAVLSTAAVLHNGLSGKNPRKVELMRCGEVWYRTIFVQDIDAYARRDQVRPARDAKVGMLPPKLAQILINLCDPLPAGSRILDPFCGTGVVLQEALLMGYGVYGTDINERMVDYTRQNLDWLVQSQVKLLAGDPGGCDRGIAREPRNDGRERRDPASNFIASAQNSVALKVRPFEVAEGDATTFRWNPPIDAVACEGYLGVPMSQIPGELKLKEQKQECEAIIMGFLKNLAAQIRRGAPVTIAVPAWLRQDGHYERLEILDDIADLGYNVHNRSRDGLIYHRSGQIVARDIIILRKM